MCFALGKNNTSLMITALSIIINKAEAGHTSGQLDTKLKTRLPPCHAITATLRAKSILSCS